MPQRLANHQTNQAWRSYRSHRSNPYNFLENGIVFQNLYPLAAVAARLAQSPLGDGRGDEHRGDGRGPGEDAPTNFSKQRSGGVGVQDAGQLAHR